METFRLARESWGYRWEHSLLAAARPSTLCGASMTPPPRTLPFDFSLRFEAEAVHSRPLRQPSAASRGIRRTEMRPTGRPTCSWAYGSDKCTVRSGKGGVVSEEG